MENRESVLNVPNDDIVVNENFGRGENGFFTAKCKTRDVHGRKRPYHHGDLRAALLQAAERALEAGNGEGLSLRELSRELGVSNTAPRRHFPHKRALVEALAVEGFGRLGAVLEQAVGSKSESFDTRIVKAAQAHIRFAAKHPALLRLMFSAKQHPEATPELLEASYKALAAGPTTITEGQAAGAVVPGDPEKLALVVFAAVEGLVALSSHGKFGGVSLDKLVVEVVGQVIAGLRPRL